MTEDAGKADLKEDYHRYVMRKALFTTAVLASIFIISGVALTLGGRDISFTQAYGIIWDHLTGNIPAKGTEAFYDDYAIWNVRLPRIIVGIVAGACLAVGGAAMQSAVKNPLADPYTTGRDLRYRQALCLAVFSQLATSQVPHAILTSFVRTF